MPNGAGVRAVIDTNVLLSGLLWRGPPRRLIEHIRINSLTLVSSPFLLAELGGVLARDKFVEILARSNSKASALLADIRRLAEIVDPPPLDAPLCRDPDDDAVLALAVAAQPDLVISGDDDLVSLGAHAGIPIVTPTQALALITT